MCGIASLMPICQISSFSLITLVKLPLLWPRFSNPLVNVSIIAPFLKMSSVIPVLTLKVNSIEPIKRMTRDLESLYINCWFFIYKTTNVFRFLPKITIFLLSLICSRLSRHFKSYVTCVSDRIFKLQIKAMGWVTPSYCFIHFIIVVLWYLIIGIPTTVPKYKI